MHDLLTLALENNGNDKTVDTKDTSHNDWNEGLENEITLEDTNGGDTNTGLSSTVSSTEVAEN